MKKKREKPEGAGDEEDLASSQSAKPAKESLKSSTRGKKESFFQQEQ